MKRLFENWRKYLLTEAAKRPRDLPDDVHVAIESRSVDAAKIFYAEEDGKPIAASRDFPWGEVFIVDVTGRADAL